jgi:hypothetical protein
MDELREKRVGPAVMIGGMLVLMLLWPIDAIRHWQAAG